MERPKFNIAALALASVFLAACGQDDASRGGPAPEQGPAAKKDAEPSPGTKGPGKVDRGTSP